jgi:hypothetical protein
MKNRRHNACSVRVAPEELIRMTAPFIHAGRDDLTCVGAYAAIVCIALASGSAGAQELVADEPTIAVTGVGRVFVAPTQAVVSLGATVER